MSSADVPAPGTVLDGKYRVERVLGEGGMGVVLEAEHLALGKRVAVKLLLAAGSDDNARERFAREARIAAQLPAEHVAAVSDYGQTSEGAPYLVMELLLGRDLQGELAARGRLPVAEAVDLVLQACEGVGEAHAVGLVHRDLKPANLFLVRRRDGTPLVKVLDFGLSKFTDDTRSKLTATQSSFGTPQYMSPEQIRSTKYVDARTDQHALAMVLYELIAGVPPYQAESTTALFVVIATTHPAPLSASSPEVPPGLDALVARALAKNPDHRFPDLVGLAAALAPFGGPGAAASAQRVAGAFSRSLLVEPAPAPAPASPSAAFGMTQVMPPAPRPAQETQSALESDPDRAPPRRTRAALILAAGAAALIGVGLGASALRSPSPAAPTAAAAAPTVTAEAPAPPHPDEPVPTVAPAASAEPTPAAPSTTDGGAPAPKPRAQPRPRPNGGPDRASDIFGQKRK